MAQPLPSWQNPIIGDNTWHLTWDLYHKNGLDVRFKTNSEGHQDIDDIQIRVAIPHGKSIFRMKLPEMKRFPINNRRSQNFPTKNQKILAEKMKHVPVYAVVNRKYKIVTSRVRRPYGAILSGGDKPESKIFLEGYSDLFNWEKDREPVDFCFFFMDRNDAADYKKWQLENPNYVGKRTIRSLGLATTTVGLDEAYKLIKTSKPRLHYYIIPDVTELDKTLALPIFGPRLSPPEMPLRKFKGTPIYVLKNTKGSGEIVFFKKDEALKFKKLHKNVKDFSLKLESLEGFLLRAEKFSKKDLENVFFQTSSDSESYVDEFQQVYNTPPKRLWYSTKNQIFDKTVTLLKNIKRAIIVTVRGREELIDRKRRGNLPEDYIFEKHVEVFDQPYKYRSGR
uniref:Conserved protein n=1 Tax=Haptophyceae sp. NIES-3900 TaxID=2748608 RepID=A0A7R6WDS5_9EUKA|nr:conserved protein [Haptophyceae sp. NIES-3900]